MDMIIDQDLKEDASRRTSPQVILGMFHLKGNFLRAQVENMKALHPDLAMFL